MKLESGICSVCGLPIYSTRRSGWLHEEQDKIEIRHRGIPKYNVDGELIKPHPELLPKTKFELKVTLSH